MCYETLQENGTFSFVIVPQYQSGKETIHIGKDLSDIAAKYFTKKETKTIQWMTQTALAVGKQKESGNSENLYIFKKRR